MPQALTKPMHRLAWLALAALAVLLALMSWGCQQRMAAQPSFATFEPCPFFDDGTTARQPPEGTVARGHLQVDRALFTGRVAPPDQEATSAADSATSATAQPPTAERPAAEAAASEATPAATTEALLASEAQRYVGLVDAFPLAVTPEVVRHGRDRYMIYCVVCHDPLGTGRGKIVERGYTRPPSYHIERLRAAPVGHLFRVVSEGYGSMPSYAAQITPRDRWAIVAYVRALQLSQHFPESDVTAVLQAKWRQPQTQGE